jgi:hypothetical protein
MIVKWKNYKKKPYSSNIEINIWNSKNTAKDLNSSDWLSVRIRISSKPVGWYEDKNFVEKLLVWIRHNLFLPFKGRCHEIFCFWFFSWISCPTAPEYSIKTVSNFFENLRRYSQLKVCHQCQRHRWQMEKIFIQKNFNNFVWSPLGSRGNIYINFCLQVLF